MCLDNWIKYFEIAAYLVAILGIIFTYLTYRNSNKIKRGEWLKDLFDKFYKEEHFADIRREIDFERIELFLEVENGKATNEKHEEAFVNYLNFFEFISILIERKHLSKAEVKDLFGYYLKSFNKIQFIKEYIKKYGFENLEKRLKEYE